MKILIIGDLHFGCRNVNLNILKMQKKYFKDELFPLIKANNISEVICLGDLLDKRTNIDFVIANYLNTEFFTFFKNNKIHFRSIIGNHDTYFKTNSSVAGPSELFKDEDYIDIIDKPRKLTYGKRNFYCIPWINKENHDEYLSYIINHRDIESFLLGHFELSGFRLNSMMVAESGTIEVTDVAGYKWVYSGHYHTPSENQGVTYLGTPYQLTWNDEPDRKKVLIYDTDIDTFTIVDTQIKLYTKIVFSKGISESFPYSSYFEKYIKVLIPKTESQDIQKELTQFVEKLQEVHPYSVQIIDGRNKKLDEVEKNTSIFNGMTPIQILNDVIDTKYKENPYLSDIKTMSSEIYNRALEIASIAQ